MADIDDIYNRIVEVRDNTQRIDSDIKILNSEVQTTNSYLKTVTDILNAGFLNLSKGIKDIIALEDFNNKQNNTIICILEKISKQTCELVNEAHKQSELQTTMAENTTDLLALYGTSHAEQFVEYNRLKEIKEELQQCCPKEVPPPPCRYTPCEKYGPGPDTHFETFNPISEPQPPR